jgi:hypothetical protein
MWVSWREGAGDFPGENARKDELLMLDESLILDEFLIQGELVIRDRKEGSGRASTKLGGGSCACCTGEEGADASSGDGRPFVDEKGSRELRRMGGDPDT